MYTIFSLGTVESFYKPTERACHTAAAVRESVIICGGRLNNTADKESKLMPPVERFNTINKVWTKLNTKGSPHTGLKGCVCAADGNLLFVYGGRPSDDHIVNGDLSQLDLTSLSWSKLPTCNAAEILPKKWHSGLVLFNKGKQLALFGGYGVTPEPSKHYTLDSTLPLASGVSNELHIFEIDEGT